LRHHLRSRSSRITTKSQQVIRFRASTNYEHKVSEGGYRDYFADEEVETIDRRLAGTLHPLYDYR